MLEFIRRNILIISITGAATLGIALLVLFTMTREQAPAQQPVTETPADVVVGNAELTEEERKAAIYALDFIYTYGNYEAPQSFLMNLEGNVTESFKPRVEQLRNIIEADNSKAFSNLKPSSENYTIRILQETSRTIAEAKFNAVLTNNQVTDKSVVVNIRMVQQDNYWLLDNVQIQ